MQFSDKLVDSLRFCRGAIPDEAYDYGYKLACILNDFFHRKFMFSPPYCNLKLALNFPNLYQATISYSIDIIRVMGFHTIDHADNHKMAAYLFKWLSRLRPEYCICMYTNEITKEEMQANAAFAFLAAKRYVDISDNFGKNELDYILYSSTHRDIHAEEWAGIFYFMEQVKKYKPTDNAVNV